MEEYQVYDPEVATNLYAELQECCQLIPHYKEGYQLLNRTFQKCLNEKTRFAGIRFNGPFAKTDYLLKERHAPPYLRRTVNDARVRLREYRNRKEEELAENFRYDVKAICQFVGLVYHVPVPRALEAVLPRNRRLQRGKLKADYLRIIVNGWDAACIYAHVDAEGADEVKVFYGGKSEHAVYKDWDWSYIGALLKKGCQLNIVRPREQEGILYPELFIWEPDFLVDISAVANCYESYAASPLNHLLNKIKPSPNTPSIVLGNLASQLLDEGLYAEDCPYGQSIRKFFRGNALSLLTAGLGQDFHAQAQRQKQNIRHILRTTLPEVLHNDGIRFHSDEIMVEPSFFSEMLGLQGRMDFLHLDCKILIEQKSGKAKFPESDPPKEQEKHYMQLLLYMQILRYNFREKYEEQHPFLLYSKYKNGLIRQAPAPDLLFAAIKLRNEIASSEYDYSRSGLSVLRTLCADDLNQNHVQGMLWERYQKPQIDLLLSPIQRATELERAYYLRFLKFIETEHLMAKVGNQTKENSGFADKWHSSLEDKQRAGNIYCGLELLSPHASESGKVEQITLCFTEKPDHEISNFRTGDIVILYPYTEGQEPDARRTLVFRATIACITADHLVLNLRAAQASSHVFWHHGKRKWAIEHDFFDSSFGPLYCGMHAFLSAPQERRDLLLLQRAPQIDRQVTLKGDYGPFNELALRAKRARDLFLIMGPPGTGKTSYGLLNTLQEELLSSDESVLLLSYTNRAVDEICSKLIENEIDFIRLGARFSCEEKYRPHLLGSKVEQCTKMDQLKDIISQARVFVGTTAALHANIHLFQLKQFGLAIIDEASQILEPHLTGLLSATAAEGVCAIRKMILIGDHKQLPAVVQQREDESAVEEPILQRIHLTNCRLSLFERLLKRYRNDPDVTYMLTRQGRMHHDIAQFPNCTFYRNKLQEVPLEHQNALLPVKGEGMNGIEDLLRTRRIAFLSIAPTRQSISDKVNSEEAQAIAATLARIYERCRDRFDPLKTAGVIVPYRNQIAEIRKWVESYQIAPLREVTIDTVERYQGGQRDYILYGFTVQKYYQLAFLTNHVFEEDGCVIDRKLNVALTRARKHLLLFGNPELLANSLTFYKLMEFARSKHGCFSIPLEDYVAGRFEVPAREKDLNFGQAAYALSPQYAEAFEQLVLRPIRLDDRTEGPDIVLGRDMYANLDAIGYGRILFRNQPNAPAPPVSPEEQALIYCYYLMRRHYCSSKTLYQRCKSWIDTDIKAFGGRVQFIDIGCGPATCGIAFTEQFLCCTADLQYIGIDVSPEMRNIGDRFLSGIFEGRLRHKSLSAFGELTQDYWEAVSESPSLILFNFAYVFSKLSSQFAEHLAQRINDIMSEYPLNKYVFIVQHSECDAQLNAYRVFRRMVSPGVSLYKRERSAFHYQWSHRERSQEFCYEILVST